LWASSSPGLSETYALLQAGAAELKILGVLHRTHAYYLAEEEPAEYRNGEEDGGLGGTPRTGTKYLAIAERDVHLKKKEGRLN